MRPGSFIVTFMSALACIWPAAAIAQMPWFDAGQQAMIIHQGDLLEQQTAPNRGGGDEEKAPGRRDARESTRPAKPPAKATSPGKDAPASRSIPATRGNPAASLDCSMAKDRERLRPEFERRVREHGEQAAAAWLRKEAAELGRRAGERAKAGLGC